jgi:CIC family chloride channel protein
VVAHDERLSRSPEKPALTRMPKSTDSLVPESQPRSALDYLRGLALAAAMGAVGALAAQAFRWALDTATPLLFGSEEDITQLFATLPWYVRVGTPTLGGAIAAVILLRARNREKRDGVVSEYLETIDGKTDRIPLVPSVLRCLSSFCSIVSGGSIGKEGAMVQLSATAGSVLCARFGKLRGEDFRLAVAMAATGGLAAVYHTPLAAAIFIAEIAFGGIELRRIGFLFTAAVASTWVVSAMGSYTPLYALPSYAFDVNSRAVLAVAAVGLAAGASGSALLYCIRKARWLFERLHRSLIVRMAAGGLLVGLMTLLAPDVTGNGFAPIARLLTGNTLATSLLVLLALKILATAATVGSGSIGGLFTPSLLVGALTGSAIAPLAAQWLGLPNSGVLLGVLGMAGALAATSQAPLMSTLMVFEMTQEPSFVFPLMLTTVVAYAVSMLFRQNSTYEVITRHRARSQQRSRLSDATVSAIMRPPGPVVTASTTLRDAAHIGVQERNRYVFVVDDDQRFLGAALTSDVMARISAQEDGGQLMDLVSADFPVVFAGQRLLDVWQTVVESPAERTPVLSDSQDRRVVGMLRKSELLRQARNLFA